MRDEGRRGRWSDADERVSAFRTIERVQGASRAGVEGRESRVSFVLTHESKRLKRGATHEGFKDLGSIAEVEQTEALVLEMAVVARLAQREMDSLKEREGSREVDGVRCMFPA